MLSVPIPLGAEKPDITRRSSRGNGYVESVNA